MSKNFILSRSSLLFLILFLFSFNYAFNAHASQKPNIKRFVIFGDSMSDTGNSLRDSKEILPSKKAYWQGRFSDGFVWTDYLAQSFKTTVYDDNMFVNMAYGGATAYPFSPEAWRKITEDYFSIKDYYGAYLVNYLEYEVQKFIDKYKRFESTDLAIFWIGGNDLIWVFEELNPGMDVNIIPKLSARKVYEVVYSCIQKHGLKNVMVVGLPDVDILPRLSGKTDKNHLISIYNQYLLQLTIDLQDKNLAKSIFVDGSGLFRTQLVPFLNEYGFEEHSASATNPSIADFTPALFQPWTEFSVYSGGNDTHVFWDELHPTTKAHSIIAALIKRDYIDAHFNTVNKDGVSFSGPESKYWLSKCNYVEVRNNGAYHLQVSASDHQGICGPSSTSLTYGQTAVISVENGSKLNFKASLGRSTTMDMFDTKRPITRTNVVTGLQTVLPKLTQITCWGSTLIGFGCGVTADSYSPR